MPPEPRGVGAEGEASFDPRTWATGATSQAQGQGQDQSQAQTQGQTHGRSAPEPLTSQVQARDRPANASRRRLVASGAGAAGLVALGAGGWVALRPRHPAETVQNGVPTGALSGEGAGAGPAETTTATVERQAMTLDGSGSIQAALSAQGLTPAAAAGAAQAARGALATQDGEIRLELATLKPALGAPRSVEARLVSLRAERPDGSGVSVTPSGQGFAATALKPAMHAATQIVRGQVDAESFYTSAVSAGLSDALIPDFFQAFVYDFDFQREIEPGAVFEAAIGEQVNDRGSAIGARRLVYAAMTTAKKAVALYRFDAPGATADDPGWYDGSGRSIRRGLMRTPIEGARISSSFGWRVHPILGFQKLHTGTDFAAPIGTPIYAAGDGTVEWAAMKGPNGNLTILQHDNGWETYYLHQNAFAPGIAPGVRVRQGQTIGWVGVTGRSTGPHLHYELHINKVPVDAMIQPLDAGKTLNGPVLASFLKQRDSIDRLRATGL